MLNSQNSEAQLPKKQSEVGLEALLADPRLMELDELQRTGDELLDVITLSENQHSNVLAWLLDPREGHGQGDEILRDLLVAASRACNETCSLDAQSSTAQFFVKWPPSVIRTTGFGSVFLAREFGIPDKQRVDIFVVDPTNKFVLVIENKASIRHSDAQLNGYKERFDALVAKNPGLSAYSTVYIALDRDFDDDSPSERPAANSWLHLGYAWLEASARRAVLHGERGNSAARLVVSYCNRQTEWESPAQKRAYAIAVELQRAHGQAIETLLAQSPGRLEAVWLNGGTVTPEMLYMLQHRGTVALLKATLGMTAVYEHIRTTVPGISESLLERGKTWVAICPPGWEHVGKPGWWILYFYAWPSDEDRSVYGLSIECNPAHARSDAQFEEVKQRLAQLTGPLAKFQGRRRRRVILETGMNLETLARTLDECCRELSGALKNPLPS